METLKLKRFVSGVRFFMCVSAVSIQSARAVAQAPQQGMLVPWGLHAKNIDYPSDHDFVMVGAGWKHYLALRANGTLVAWGEHTWSLHVVPQAILNKLAAGGVVTKISCGYAHNLVLFSDGIVMGWGEPASTTLPENVAPGSPPPTQVFGARHVDIAAGEHISMAVNTAGSVERWGEFSSINGGDDPSTQCRPGTPSAPWPWAQQGIGPSGNDFIAVRSTGHYGLAMRQDGSVVGWGVDGRCQVSDIPQGPLNTFSAGHMHGACLNNQNGVWCWGMNHFGQGTSEIMATCPSGCAAAGGCATTVCYKPPPHLAGLVFRDVRGGYYHNIGWLVNGTLVGWGKNLNLQCEVPAGRVLEFSCNYDDGYAIVPFLAIDSYCNCDGSDSAPFVGTSDVQCFLQKFATFDTYADCDGNGIIDVADYNCFLGRLVAEIAS
jgi:alpha-tubulin suppressor-like RCC1 family protein